MKLIGIIYKILIFNKIILKDFSKKVENDLPCIVSLRCQKRKQGPATPATQNLKMLIM